MNLPRLFDRQAEKLKQKGEKNPRPYRRAANTRPIWILLAITGWLIAFIFMFNLNRLGVENERLISKNADISFNYATAQTDLSLTNAILKQELKEKHEWRAIAEDGIKALKRLKREREKQ